MESEKKELQHTEKCRKALDALKNLDFATANAKLKRIEHNELLANLVFLQEEILRLNKIDQEKTDNN
jgi:hypothetical protein